MLRFRGSEELDAMAARLRNAPRRLRNELESQLAAAARPAAQDVRREIRGISMAQRKAWSGGSGRRVGSRLGRGSSPLRSPIAAAVQVRAGVQGSGAFAEIELREGHVPARARWFLPFVLGRKKRLRHPFMGRWRHGVNHTGGSLDKWWPVLKPHMPRFRKARDQAIRRIDRYLEG